MLKTLVDVNNYITCSKPVAKILGLNAAVILGELCSLSNLFNDREFYCTMDRLSEETCLSERAVRASLKVLVEYGILRIVRKGLPRKNYYYIDKDKLSERLGILLDEYSEKKKKVIEAKGCGTDKCPLKNCEACSKSCHRETVSDSKSDTTGDSKSDTTFKKEIRERNNDKDIITSEPPSKQSCPPSPRNDVERVEVKYMEMFDSLRKNGRINLVDYNWGGGNLKVRKALIRRWLDRYPVQRVCSAMELAAKDDWIVNETSFCLTVILSNNVFARLLNGKRGTTKGPAFSDGERDYGSTDF